MDLQILLRELKENVEKVLGDEINLRHEADYEIMMEVPKERIVKFSKEFLDFTKDYLTKKWGIQDDSHNG